VPEHRQGIELVQPCGNVRRAQEMQLQAEAAGDRAGHVPLAGIIVAPIVLVQYDTGIPLGIKGFVACIIGGLGKPTGAAVGGLLLGVLEAFATGLLSSGYKNAIAFVLLLVFLFVRPGGLFGELERVES